jgi:hypothetical protein
VPPGINMPSLTLGLGNGLFHAFIAPSSPSFKQNCPASCVNQMQAQEPIFVGDSEVRAVQLANQALELVASGRAEVHRRSRKARRSR